MGASDQTVSPVIQNQCVDEDYLYTVPNFCAANSAESYNAPNTADFPPNTNTKINYDTVGAITAYCQLFGGTYPPTPSNPTNRGASYSDKEWGFGNTGEFCPTDPAAPGSTVVSGSNIINGLKGICKKNANYGDPISCCLRDYQCSGSASTTAPTCFSDDYTNSTCPREFRATDTLGCNYLMNQLCLGNIPEAFGSTGIDDFTKLWTDPNNPDTSNPWTVTGTPSGTVYRNEQDISNTAECTYDKNGVLNGTSKGGTSCPTHIWAVGATGAPPTQLPQPTPFNFSMPPCQQIFWRTLYGNQPTFTNQYWAPYSEGTGQQTPSQDTSIPPQLEACGPIPFSGNPTPTGLQNGGAMLEKAVEKFVANGGSLVASEGRATDAPFVNWVLSVCAEYPGLCTNILQKTCQNVTPQTILSNPQQLQWCGCYMAPTAYSEYTNVGISKECSPYCNAADVIPLVDDFGNRKICTQSICVIDDVTLNLAYSRVEGQPITFNQICNSCSGANDNGLNVNTNGLNGDQTNTNNTVATSCQCIINNFNLTTIGATINGGINISEACNGNAKCYRTQTLDGVQQRTEVDCHSGSASGNNVAALEEAKLIKKANDTSNLWILLIFFIVILIIILAWIIIAPRGTPQTDIEFSKTIELEAPKIPSLGDFLYNPITNYNTNIYGKVEKKKFF